MFCWVEHEKKFYNLEAENVNTFDERRSNSFETDFWSAFVDC